jgi:hypothetical protein
VQDILRMEVVNSLAELEKPNTCLIFFEFLLHFDVLVERPFLHILHHDVEVESITEKAVNLDDVGMVRVEIYLQLHHELIKH